MRPVYSTCLFNSDLLLLNKPQQLLLYLSPQFSMSNLNRSQWHYCEVQQVNEQADFSPPPIDMMHC